MTPRLLSLASGLVRGWARLYTWGLPASVRERRLAEIESDLWELRSDAVHAPDVNPTLHVVLRLVAGMPDDLRWRVENVAGKRRALRATLALVATAMVITTVWIFTSVARADLPRPPAAAPLQWPPRPMPAPPPPPPPPPSPCSIVPTADCVR